MCVIGLCSVHVASFFTVTGVVHMLSYVDVTLSSYNSYESEEYDRCRLMRQVIDRHLVCL